MIIHFFTKSDSNMPSSRQRAHLLAEELQKYQVDTVIHTPSVVAISETPWPRKFRLILDSAKALLRVKKGDVIFLQRTIYNKYFFVLVLVHHFFFRRKIIFDFDDAIYLHSFFKTQMLVRVADVVMVGSHELLNWAKRYNKESYFVPTCTYFTSFPPKVYSSEHKEKLVLGWVGTGPSHRENLALLVPVFQELVRRAAPIRFVLVGAHGDRETKGLFASITGLDMEIVDWVEPTKMADVIRTFDVGLMPMTDTAWNRGKCALKIIEYMACGVPAIASPVGENNYVVQNGVNGYLPSTTEEWVAAVEHLCGAYGDLEKLGTNARKTIEGLYSFEIQLIHILDIVQK